MITTTLAKIRKNSPCKDGWKKLYKSLGGIKAYGEHTPVKFSQIVESNGLDDALWCLRTISPEHDKEVRLFAADCAERVLHLYEEKYDDPRPRKAIQAARDFAEGKITEEQRAAARDATWDAAWTAARDAARDAAKAAAWDAARDAARDAAKAAAWDAAWDARAAAWTAAKAAARDATWDAAWTAARDAGAAAWTAARDAGAAAWDAEEKIQTEMLIERFS